MTIEFCYLVFITVDYYIINNFIIKRFLVRKKYVFFILGILATIAFSAWLRTLLAIQMNVHFFHLTQIDYRTLYINSVINISLWILLITIGKMLIDRIQTQNQLELLENEKIKSELAFLKAQINPHALFNSINTIYGHIDKSNQVARNILLQFSELLRYQLYECSAEKVNLGKEISYIKNYIAFQKLRKDDGLFIDVQIEPVETKLDIAPLLLVVLIENAFKFVGNIAGKQSSMMIKIGLSNNVLVSSFTNTKEPEQMSVNDNSNGIGIINLKRRLELLYHGKYSFSLRDEGMIYEANLNIELS